MNINDKITKHAIEKMQDEINEANGNEVFFRGILNEENLVLDVEVLARGNSYSAPAIIKRMNKNEVIIHNHPSGYLYPSDNDISISSVYGNMGGGSYIINNEVDDIYVIVEPFSNKMEKISVTSYFEEDSKINKIFPDYEFRSEQLEMVSSIEEGLNSGTKVLIEAGTGTGKTLAYLIPAIEWAILNKKRVVVSTNTINLQEQLIQKDLPLVKRILEKNFNYYLVKGRGNYVCIRKMKNIRLENIDELNEERKNILTSVINWAVRTNTGDKNELNFEPPYAVWEFVNSESDMCLKSKCPYRDKCFFNKARKSLVDADVLVANHHIYFADLEIRKATGFSTSYSILPDYDVAIFDEAHNIEGIARDYFSYKVSKYSFNKFMHNVYNYKGERKGKGGAIPRVLGFLRENGLVREEMTALQSFFDARLGPLHKSVYEKGNDFFAIFITYFKEHTDKGDNKVRMREDNLNNDIAWKNTVLKRYKLLKSEYIAYYKLMKEFLELVEDTDIDDDNGLFSDLRTYTDRLSAFFKDFETIIKLDMPDYVYWTEINTRYANAVISATPLQITNELQENLYNKMDNIVFTSATLAIEDNFNYFKKSIGISEEIIEKIINSPFDYKKQMQVLIPSDIKTPAAGDFIASIKEFLIQICNHTKGNIFLLFTSYSTMRYTYNLLKKQLAKNGYDLYLQGELPRHKLLELYRLSEHPVLFGTDSFWEGVDVKGEKLKSVVIIKLPFKVPTEPVVEAIIENISKNGGNPFMEYQVPEALIKFKQGIGRLIRSKTDTGYLSILDTRILTKFYGKKFLEILKKGNVNIGPHETILKNID